jgi:hypothetical protein
MFNAPRVDLQIVGVGVGKVVKYFMLSGHNAKNVRPRFPPF